MSLNVPANRYDGIDVLRGISIVAVLLHHINLRFLLNDVPVAGFLPKQLENILFWNGANGVTVFFAISGFLITTTAMRRWNSLDQVKVVDFYQLRFARIAPLLLALVAVLSLLHLAHAAGFVIPPERASLSRALLAALTFHINWLESMRGYLPANWDVLWSLSVEEVFYLFFPVLCWLTGGRRLLIAVLLGFVLVGPFARTVLTKNELWAEYGYLSSMDAIALGCLAAMLARRLRGSPRLLLAIESAGALLLLLVMGWRPWVEGLFLYRTGLDVTVLAIGTCLVMMAVVLRNRVGHWGTAWLRWFGRQSYEVYLTHMFVVLWAVQIFVATGASLRLAAVWYVLAVAFSAALGGMVARWYSEPCNRNLRRVLPLAGTTGERV